MSADGRPRLAIAMGDPTGIGPELVARVFGQAEIFARCRPLAIGAAAVRLADRTLRRAGYAAPRIAVAALNPHGGEGGLFGLEERDIIEPGVRTAQAEGIGAEGPYPADTIFLRARRTRSSPCTMTRVRSR